jgi:hypothetical protein
MVSLCALDTLWVTLDHEVSRVLQILISATSSTTAAFPPKPRLDGAMLALSPPLHPSL